ncbi:MAG: hypothetical protein HYY96_08465 [Candidatus Tectomicrobia bacterium]|nr:hypothetical protein [Candidatus Tectomicrobia bacterium]
MPAKLKFTDEELLNLRRQGLNPNQIAKKLGVQPASVRERLRKIGARTAASGLDVARSRKLVDGGLAVMEQLGTINEEAHRLMEELRSDPKLKDNPRAKASSFVKVLNSILDQIKFQVEAWKIMWDVNEHKNFQTVVLQAIGEADPATRDKIVERLNRDLSVRALLNQSPDLDAPTAT